MDWIEITVSNDPCTLGPEATGQDIESFSEAFGQLLTDEFGVECRVRSVSTLKLAEGGATAQSLFDLAEDVAARARDIQQGDEWLMFLSG